MTKKKTIVGIDLGTSYSCIAVWNELKILIITNKHGNNTTPSYVCFDEGGRYLGEDAKAKSELNPGGTIFDIKRLIGKRYQDDDVQNDKKHWPFKVVDYGDGMAAVQVPLEEEETLNFRPEEISAMILGGLIEAAESQLGEKINEAVITVPAHFNNMQRQATLDAAKIAGLEVKQLLSEPVAAAIAYGLERQIPEASKTLFVFDLGGGTFDVSIVVLRNGNYEVKANSGDTHLGGEDFDNRLIVYLLDEFKMKFGIDLSNDIKAVKRLRSACEAAKRTLSTCIKAQIDIPNLYGSMNFQTFITRASFENLCEDLFESTKVVMNQALGSANLTVGDIDEVLLVGGSTRIPKVKSLVTLFFNNKAPTLYLNPDEAIAYGAAVKAGHIGGRINNKIIELKINEITPLSLGVGVLGDVMSVVIPESTSIPVRKHKVFTNAGENQDSMQFEVYQGNRAENRNNHLLGKFTLTDIKADRRGDSKVKVHFDITKDNILTVFAENLDTNDSNQIVITKDHANLSEEEIRSMKVIADKYKQADELVMKKVKVISDLEEFIYGLRDQIELGFRSKLKSSIVNKAYKDAKDWLNMHRDDGTFELFQSKLESLKNLYGKVANDEQL